MVFNMLNKKPIFIFGFTGGGTGILWDLIITHPQCMTPGPEINQIFYYSRKREVIYKIKLHVTAFANGFNYNYLKLFNHKNIHVINYNKMLKNNNFLNYIDQTFYQLKVNRALHHIYDKYKYPNEVYSIEEAENTRLVTKSIEGACLAASFWNEVYEDAKFICIIRNGLACAESKLRHKRVRNILQAAKSYNFIGNYLYKFNQNNENCLLIRYEDYIDEPQKTIEKIYKHLDLDIKKVQKFKIQSRSNIITNEKETNKEIGKKYWYSFDEIDNFFIKDINKKAMKNLKKNQIDEFLEIAGDIFYKFNYKI